jgi:lysophospholipase L1-like esterase
VRRALFAAWCVLAALSLLEAATRWLEDDAPRPIVASREPRLVYELNAAHPEINADGLRGRELDRAWLRDAFVIAAIGDSHTYSVHAVSYETSYPAQLERALRRLGHGRAAVLNFGVPGYNAAQELEVLRARALAFEPDLAILQVTENDSHVCNYIQPRHPRLNRLVHRSHFLVLAWTSLLYRLEVGREALFRFVAWRLPDALLFEEGLVGTLPDPQGVHPTDDPAWVPERYHYMLGRENQARHVQEFARLARAHGAALLATGFIAPQDEPLYREAGFDVLPFSRIFSDADLRRFGYRPGHGGDHLNDAGSEFLANALARHIDARLGAAAAPPGG